MTIHSPLVEHSLIAAPCRLFDRIDPNSLVPCDEDPGDVIVGVISPCEEGQHLQHRFFYHTYLHLTESK